MSTIHTCVGMFMHEVTPKRERKQHAVLTCCTKRSDGTDVSSSSAAFLLHVAR